MSVNDFLKDPEYRSKLGYYDIFQDFFNRLIWSYTRLRPMFHSEEEPNDKEGALTIFIDDLDRCPEPRIIRVLETIKLFMDKKGCIFVIGAADEIIHKALRTQNYSETDAREFMDKIVQVTFNLPPVDDMEFKDFLKNLVIDEDIEKIMPHMDAIVRATHSNIRKFKRFLNDLYLMDGINRYRATGIEFNSLLLWKVLMFQAPELKGETIQTILMIQNRIQTLLDKKAFDQEGKIAEDVLKKEVREISLHSYLSNHQVVTLFRQFDLNESRLKQLITIGDTVKSETTKEVEESEKGERRMKGGHEFDLMAKVKKGPFLFGEKKEKRIIEKDFEIDVYPVTNSQFRRFIEKKGYEEKEFWSDKGWTWREKEKVAEPSLWTDKTWNKADYPVVGVSFYEAEAYAKWSGKRLPAEEEWERAARGTDGLIYPWGDEFDREKCNTKESRIEKTTAVTRYPNGISPDGCYDMFGNVWEWTSSFFGKAQDRYVIKGLSFGDGGVGSGCSARNYYFPNGRRSLIGFRCVRTLL